MRGESSIVTFVDRRAFSWESYLRTPKLQFTSAIRPCSKTMVVNNYFFFNDTLVFLKEGSYSLGNMHRRLEDETITKVLFPIESESFLLPRFCFEGKITFNENRSERDILPTSTG